MRKGWVKLHRKLLDDPQFRDPDVLALWIHLIMNANYEATTVTIGSRKIPVARGQLITGRQSLSLSTGVQESKIQRILKRWQSEHQIEQQTFTKYRLISIVNYDSYQVGEQQNDDDVNTEKELINNNKKSDHEFIKPSAVEVAEYLHTQGLCMKESKEQAERFFNYYESVGWKVGKSRKPMTNWKNATINWKKNYEKRNQNTKRSQSVELDFESTGWSAKNIQ